MATVHGRFAEAEPELSNGFAEHTTMGAEAMLALGLEPAAVVTWSLRHEPVPVPAESPLRAVRGAIADELADADWRDVLRHRARPLLDRLDTHLFHGLIRTAHATRALERHDGPEARAELVAGLAAWTIWADTDRSEIRASPSADPLAEILQFARRGAAAFAATPSIVTLHAVTAPMAYLLVANHLDGADHAIAAGVFSHTHRRYPAPPARTDSRLAPTPAQLAGLLQQWDAHPAKLVEAALRGLAHTGDAAFSDAAASVLG